MSSIPVNYNYINTYNSTFSPSELHAQNTGLSRFFQKYLLQKAISVFEWRIPENWDRDFFLYGLYCFGHMAVVDTDKFGVIPQLCGLRGYDIFYRPTHAVITNPLLRGILQPQIDVQCAVFKMNADYTGIMDIVTYYADNMALCAQTAAVNTMNSKLSYVFFAGNKAGAESYKKMMDGILSGEPFVVVDKALEKPDGGKTWEMFSQNVGQNYIAGTLLEDLRKWEQMFMTAIGLPNANTDKKERLIVDEVNANNRETDSNAEMWLERFKKSCDKCRELFGIEISVDWRDENGVSECGGPVQSRPDDI